MEHSKQYNVVVVDDEQTTCDYLSLYIEDAFPQAKVIGHFYNGNDAWSFLQKHRVDCLVTDIKMPQLSGLDLARLIHKNQIPTKVIIISGYSDFEYAHQGIKYQVKDYLLKPIDYEELSFVISSVLELEHPSAKISFNGQVAAKGYDRNFQIVSKATEYVNQNYRHPISRDDVAATLYLSSAYFGRIFKEHTGCSFSEYLTQVRMEAAVELLKTNHSVQEIAQMVGYNNIRHFTRTFKVKYGCPPREYRIRNL